MKVMSLLNSLADVKWLQTRETDLRNNYMACYVGFTSQKAKRGEPVDEAELVKRCGKAKRETDDKAGEPGIVIGS